MEGKEMLTGQAVHTEVRFPNSRLSLPLPLRLFGPREVVLCGNYLLCVCCCSATHSTPWTAARQASLAFIISQSLLKLMSIQLVIHPAISSSVVPFSCPQSFPASGSFPISWLFVSGDQSIEASASSAVLPMNIQD